MSAGAPLARFSLDDLVALNDEIVALVRAGVPLHLGLGALSQDMPGRLGRLSARISERLATGESLEQILGDQANSGVPKAYAAVVAAGMRAGRLSSALEGIAHALRRHAQLRRTITLSLVYPLLIVVITYSFLAFWVTKVAPQLAIGFAAWGEPSNWFTRTATFLGDTKPLWQYGLPALLFFFGLWLWLRSGQALHGERRARWWNLGIVGRLRRMRTVGQKALFADVLGVLLEHGTPLDEALLIAGQTVDHPTFREGASQLAERIRNGQPPTTNVNGFPPVIGCLLTSVGGASPADALRRVARTYHDDASRRARRLATNVPIFFTAIFAGGSVLFYAAVTIVPWLLLLHRIATEAGK
jgi:general secretion pathway protein F